MASRSAGTRTARPSGTAPAAPRGTDRRRDSALARRRERAARYARAQDPLERAEHDRAKRGIAQPSRPPTGRTEPGPKRRRVTTAPGADIESTYATMAGVPPAAPVAFACSRRSGRCARRLSPSREGCRENRSTNRRVNWSWANSARHRAGLRFRWDEPVSSRQFRRLRPTVACTTDFYSFSRQPRVEAQARRLRHQAAQAQTEHRGTLDSSTRLALTRVSQPSLSVLRDPCPLTAPAPRAMLRSVLSRPRGVCRCGG